MKICDWTIWKAEQYERSCAMIIGISCLMPGWHVDSQLPYILHSKPIAMTLYECSYVTFQSACTRSLSRACRHGTKLYDLRLVICMFNLTNACLLWIVARNSSKPDYSFQWKGFFQSILLTVTASHVKSQTWFVLWILISMMVFTHKPKPS